MPERTYGEYLTKNDWQEIPKYCKPGAELTTAAYLLGQTHRMLDRGELKYAIVEGVSAIEQVVEEFFRRTLTGASINTVADFSPFYKLPLPAKVILACQVQRIAQANMDATVRIIDIRNEKIHEGLEPPPNAADDLRTLMKVVAALLPNPNVKFPTGNLRSNSIN